MLADGMNQAADICPGLTDVMAACRSIPLYFYCMSSER